MSLAARLVLLGSIGLVAVAATGFVLRPDLTSPASLGAATAAVAGVGAPDAAEWARLEAAAAGGDPVAVNNLGVALLRSPKRGDAAKAQALFEKAAAAGLIPARYNLALLLPDTEDTATAIIEKRLQLLASNVDSGDVPSMVALAHALRFANRATYYPDREGAIRTLLKRAAASGDADYQLRYLRALRDQLRDGADPALVDQAIPLALVLDQAGDPRAAELLGDLLSLGIPAPEGLPADPLHWYARAGDLGLDSARCAYGLAVFHDRDWIFPAGMPRDERRALAAAALQDHGPETVARAIAELEHCATAPQPPRAPNLPFGEDALYASKLRGGQTSLGTAPGWASVTLGVLYGYGISVPQDRARAGALLDQAAKRDLFLFAHDIRNALPDV